MLHVKEQSPPAAKPADGPGTCASSKGTRHEREDMPASNKSAAVNLGSLHGPPELHVPHPHGMLES